MCYFVIFKNKIISKIKLKTKQYKLLKHRVCNKLPNMQTAINYLLHTRTIKNSSPYNEAKSPPFYD